MATDLMAEQLDAQLRETEASLEVLEAQARARNAGEELDEISGLRKARESIKVKLFDIRKQAQDDAAATRQELEAAMQVLQADIQRARAKAGEKYWALDEALERHLYARLDEADARLRVWKARLDQDRATDQMAMHDDLATLEESIALARARSAEAAHDRANRKAQEALEEAARHFDEAYVAAASRYGA